ncbi:MAG: tRNA (N6-threonylcarbamoyladenosine(37)-N6)-methyltransferase TrmO, partial [Victivallaceae bacterium]
FGGRNLEAALTDLSGFDRIWIIFKFHLNQTWNPKVAPPVITPPSRKVGVLASRSPHRPNPLGLSCVELVKIEGLKLHIRNFDLLDGTPVLDIKPYIPKVDAFPDSRAGWVDDTAAAVWQLNYSELFTRQSDFIFQHSSLDLLNFCRIQLSIEPLNFHRKRLRQLSETEFEIACRTWRIGFDVSASGREITIKRIKSGYLPEELFSTAPDPYADKQAHRAFIELFHQQ